MLYPAVTRDLLLTLAAEDAFAPIWTDEIIDEMRRNVLADRPDIVPANLDANTIAAMNRAFPTARLTGFEVLSQNSATPGYTPPTAPSTTW